MAIKKAKTRTKSSVTSQGLVANATKTRVVTSPTRRRITFSSMRALPHRTSVGALLAEFIGTFLLAAIVVVGQGQPIIMLFALAAIVLSVGVLSGAHLNPALTFGAWITRQITGFRALGYVVAQVLGAMLALVTLSALLGGQPGTPNPVSGETQAAELYNRASAIIQGKEWYAFFAELLGASIFGFAVANAFRNHRERFAAAYTVSGGLFLGLFIAGSTAILNPAVALTLQAVKWEVWPLAVYIFAPLVGAAIGFIVYEVLRTDVGSTIDAEPTGTQPEGR